MAGILAAMIPVCSLAAAADTVSTPQYKIAQNTATYLSLIGQSDPNTNISDIVYPDSLMLNPYAKAIVEHIAASNTENPLENILIANCLIEEEKDTFITAPYLIKYDTDPESKSCKSLRISPIMSYTYRTSTEITTDLTKSRENDVESVNPCIGTLADVTADMIGSFFGGDTSVNAATIDNSYIKDWNGTHYFEFPDGETDLTSMSIFGSDTPDSINLPALQNLIQKSAGYYPSLAKTMANPKPHIIINIPSKINGFVVTSIDEDAFKYCDAVTDIIIPGTVLRDNCGDLFTPSKNKFSLYDLQTTPSIRFHSYPADLLIWDKIGNKYDEAGNQYDETSHEPESIRSVVAKIDGEVEMTVDYQWSPLPVPNGDIDGDGMVSASDAVRLLRVSAELDEPSTRHEYERMLNATKLDASSDSETITASTALQVLRYSLESDGPISLDIEPCIIHKNQALIPDA